MSGSKKARGTCPQCGRDVALRVPKGGDGADLRPVRHNKPDSGERCDGWLFEAEDEGSPRVGSP